MRRALLVIAVTLTACGPGDYRAFREQLTGATCDWAVRCGYVTAADRGHCPVDALLTIFNDDAATRMLDGAIDVAGSIDAGRLRYDDVNAQACLDAVSGAACDLDLARRERRRGCNAVVSAHTATDQACWADFECTGGLCARIPGCAGVCVAYASYGQPCVLDGDAPAAIRCDPTVAFCAEETPGGRLVCQQKKPEGSPCTDTVQCSYDWTCRLGVCTDPVELDENEPCGGTDPCKEGTYCDPGTQLCTAQHKQGEACDAPLGCEDGLACIGLKTMGDKPGTCAPWLVTGSACDQQTPNDVSGCPADTDCVGGTCSAPQPLAAIGESCADRPCAAGLGCDVRMLCDYTIAIFGDCSGDRVKLCAPGLDCAMDRTSSVDQTCVPTGVQACFLPMSD